MGLGSLALLLVGCGAGIVPGSGVPVPPQTTAPVLTLSTASVNFGPVTVGTTTAAQTITATNTGTALLSFNSIAMTGANVSQFAETSACGSSLAVGASCTVAVSFSPSGAAAASASVVFTTNAAASPQGVALSGTGVTAGISAVTLSPTSLAFGSVSLGVSSTQTVLLTSSGTVALNLNLSGFNFTGAGAAAFSQTNTCTTVMAVGASCTISVTFAPVATGAVTAAMSVVDDAPNTPQSVGLSGTGAGVPVAMLTPAFMNFGSVNLGATSSAQVATLTNTGSGVLNITGVSVTGVNAAAFNESTTCGATLAAGASCTISVTFAPTATGAMTAMLSVQDDSSGGLQTVLLSGNGVGVAAATLTPAVINFGTVAAGSTSAAQVATLASTGSGTLTISGAALSGSGAAAFSFTTTCGATLNSGSNCAYSVKFNPAVAGTYSAVLSVSDNAPNSPQTVMLSGGTSGVPAVTLSCSIAAFGEVVKLTASATQSCTLTNSGNAALTISALTISGANASSFSQSDNCGATVAANASCTVTLTATPQAIGLLAASLTFTDNAPNSPQSVGLTASGVKAHYQGLVTMNNAKLVNNEPDNTMEELNAHPNIYVGAVVKVNWAQLEPSQGVFDKSAIEAALATIDAYNAKYPTGPHVTAKLRVQGSTFVPAWIFTDTGSVSTTNGTLGAFWSAEYTKQWRLMVAWLASVYDLDERVQEIAMSSCASNTDEPFVLVHGTTNTPALIAAGYTDAAYHTCLNGAGTDYAPFKFTPLDFTFNGEGSLQQGNTYVSDQNASDAIMDAFRAQYPVRSVVANHGLGNPSTTGQTTIYANFATLYNNAQAMPPPRNYGLEFQTYNQQVDWDTSIAQAESLHATEVEIWDTKAAGGLAPLSTTQLQGYAAGIAKD